MKISFDFDQTLSYYSVQLFALDCKNLGCSLYIVTGRSNDKFNEDLYEIAKNLNIPKENIVFMNMKNKSEFFKNNSDFLFHLDDDQLELEFIEEETDVKGINVFCNVDWKEECLTIIENAKANK